MKYVVITTDLTRRGVFGGELVSKEWIESQNTWNVTLKNAKMAVHWCSDVKGVTGLAKTGNPNKRRVCYSCVSLYQKKQ